MKFADVVPLTEVQLICCSPPKRDRKPTSIVYRAPPGYVTDMFWLMPIPWPSRNEGDESNP